MELKTIWHSFLSLLGFKTNEENEVADMYGCPPTEFQTNLNDEDDGADGENGAKP